LFPFSSWFPVSATFCRPLKGGEAKASIPCDDFVDFGAFGRERELIVLNGGIGLCALPAAQGSPNPGRLL